LVTDEPSTAVRDWRVQPFSITVSSSDNGTNTRGADHFPVGPPQDRITGNPSVGSRAARALGRPSILCALMRTTSWSTASAGAPATGPTLDPVVLCRAACEDIPQLRQRSNGPLTRTDGGLSGGPAERLTFW